MVSPVRRTFHRAPLQRIAAFTSSGEGPKGTRLRLAFFRTPIAINWIPKMGAVANTSPTRYHSVFADRVNDDHPRVRLEGVRMCATLDTRTGARIAMQALNHPLDRFLEFALWQTARDLKAYWLPEVQAGRNPFEKIEHLTFAAQGGRHGGGSSAAGEIARRRQSAGGTG